MFVFFFFNDTATTEIYTLSLHDALPISSGRSTRSSGSIGASCENPPARLLPRLVVRRLLGRAREPRARASRPPGDARLPRRKRGAGDRAGTVAGAPAHGDLRVRERDRAPRRRRRRAPPRREARGDRHRARPSRQGALARRRRQPTQPDAAPDRPHAPHRAGGPAARGQPLALPAGGPPGRHGDRRDPRPVPPLRAPPTPARDDTPRRRPHRGGPAAPRRPRPAPAAPGRARSAARPPGRP